MDLCKIYVISLMQFTVCRVVVHFSKFWHFLLQTKVDSTDFFVSCFWKGWRCFYIETYDLLLPFFNSFIMRNRKGLQVNHVKQSSKVIRVVRSELQNSSGSSSELQSPVSKSGTYYKSQISGKENSLHCWLQCTGASKRISC